MTSSKLLKILLLITGTLAFILVAVLILHRPHLSDSPFSGDLDKAQSITVQNGALTLQLTRGGTDDWSVSMSSAGPFKADTDKVKTLISGLKDMRVDDVISEHGDQAADFGLNPESATVITVHLKGASHVSQGLFGKQAPDYNHIYFRYPDQPAIYLAHSVGRGELGEPGLDSWRDRTIVNVVEDQILTLVIDGPGYKTALARSSDTWSMNGTVVEPGPVWFMLGQIAHLKADQFLDPGEKIKPLTYASILIQSKDGHVHTLHLGKPDTGSKEYHVALDQDMTVYGVNESVIQSLLRKPGDFRPMHPVK